jgi:hypothetical protein
VGRVVFKVDEEENMIEPKLLGEGIWVEERELKQGITISGGPWQVQLDPHQVVKLVDFLEAMVR